MENIIIYNPYTSLGIPRNADILGFTVSFTRVPIRDGGKFCICLNYPKLAIQNQYSKFFCQNLILFDDYPKETKFYCHRCIFFMLIHYLSPDPCVTFGSCRNLIILGWQYLLENTRLSRLLAHPPKEFFPRWGTPFLRREVV